ncbi:MAG: hypothetical protein AB1714_29075 [Acidobacteriota bacterium]
MKTVNAALIDERWQRTKFKSQTGFESKERRDVLDRASGSAQDSVISEELLLGCLTSVVTDLIPAAKVQAKAGLASSRRALREVMGTRTGYELEQARERLNFLAGAFRWVVANTFNSQTHFTKASAILRAQLDGDAGRPVDQEELNERLSRLLSYDLCLVRFDQAVADYRGLLSESQRKGTFRIPSPAEVLSELPHFLNAIARAGADATLESIRGSVMEFYGRLLTPAGDSEEPILIGHGITWEHHFLLSIVIGRIFLGVKSPVGCIRPIRGQQRLLVMGHQIRKRHSSRS